MIELGKEHYTKEELKDLQKVVIQYYTTLGEDVSGFEEMDQFLAFFLETVSPKNQEVH